MSKTYTYGDRLTLAGYTWEVRDARDTETGYGEPLANLRPIDPATGDTLTTVRIGRADRDNVYIHITASHSGELKVNPSMHGYATTLTARQRELLLTELAGIRFNLPPLTAQERVERLTREIASRATREASHVMQYRPRMALRDALDGIPAGDREHHRTTVLEGACAAFRERLASELANL